MLMLNSIPKLQARLQCWLFVLKFDESFSELSQVLNRATEACKVSGCGYTHANVVREWLMSICSFLRHQQLRGSQHLKHVFEIVLTLGNYMNGGTRICP